MRQSSFGHKLRDTRVRKGIEFNAAARRLRIRPDVLRAIEEENFDQMPPRGYARNMINSYARFLGLNASELTREYLDAQHDYDRERQMANARPTGFDMNLGRTRFTTARNEYEKRTGSAFVRSDDQFRYMSQRSRKSNDGSGAINGLGRRVYREDSMSYNREADRVNQQLENANRTHRERYRRNANDDYLNVYGGRTRNVRGSHASNGGGFDIFALGPILPIAAGGLVLLLLLGFLFFMILGPKSNANTVDPMPETTVSTSSATDDDTNKAPTNFEFEFTIDGGTQKWVEVHVDGKTIFAETVNGPRTETFTIDGKLEFVCYGTNGVVATVDGKKQKLKAGSDGLVHFKKTLADVLADWADSLDEDKS